MRGVGLFRNLLQRVPVKIGQNVQDAAVLDGQPRHVQFLVNGFMLLVSQNYRRFLSVRRYWK